LQLQRIIRIVLSLAIVAVFVLYTGGKIPIQLFDRLENLSYDFRLRLTLPNTVDEKIVILDIDERSLAEVGRWPWPRDVLARIVDNLFDRYGAKAVGFDIVFAERDESSGLNVLNDLAQGALRTDQAFLAKYQELRPQLENDRIFAESLAGRRVVMGFAFLRTRDEDEANRIGTLPEEVGDIGQYWTDRIPLFQNIDHTANLEVLQRAAYSGGFFDNPSVDEDGIFRRVPLLQVYDGKLYQSLAMAMVRAGSESPDVAIEVWDDSRSGYYAVEGVRVGDYSIPVDGTSAILVPYRGARKHFPYVSMVDVLNGNAEPTVLKDRLILVGTTAAGLLDLRSTPVEEVFPGVEVHANIISGILEQRIKHRPQYAIGFELVVELLVGLVMSFLLPFISPLLTLLVTLVAFAGIIGITLFAWITWDLVLPMAALLLLTLSIFVFHMSYGFFVESRGKRQLAHLFGQYVPPELVDEMSQHPQEVTLEGQSREMTVLFSDVRGFTGISEGLDPKELTQLMNAFLTPMTQIIHKHRGTIDKYMGDAIMSFWGAPLDDPMHARNALLAAFEMNAKLIELQPEFERKSWPEIRIGIGLNTGVMNVGNMGSEFRMAYTCLGDAVNLGSRLEGLTKQYGVTLIVSESTKHSVPEFEYRELDVVRVKGKDKPVTIYEPIGPVEDIAKSLRSELRRFHKALVAFRNQEWDIAEREIFSLSQENKICAVYGLYLDRIMHYRNNSPGTDWDGVFTHETK
jgi:adenylate cyclase